MGKKEIKPDWASQVPDLKEYSIYQQEIEKLKKLCSSIQKEKSKEVSQALKNYVIIRLIGVSENLLKSMTADLIDEFKISAASMLEGDIMELHLDQLNELKSENITMGKIVTTTFGLSNAVQIALIFEKINGMKESYAEAKKKKRKEGRIQTSMLFFDWLQELSPFDKKERDLFREADKLLKDRNDITHNVTDYHDSADSLLIKITDWQGLINMMWFASFIHLSRNRKKLQKQNATTCEQSFGMKLDEFYKITGKYTKN